MKSERVRAVLLHPLLPGNASFNSRTRQKEAEAPARRAIRFELVDGAKRRKISSIVEIDFGTDREPATQHDTVARSGADGKNQWHLLKAPNPNRIQALVVNPKRREKSPRGDGDEGIGDEVDLEIIEFFFDFPAVRPTTFGTLEFTFEFASGLNQPSIAQRQQNYWVHFRN